MENGWLQLTPTSSRTGRTGPYLLSALIISMCSMHLRDACGLTRATYHATKFQARFLLPAARNCRRRIYFNDASVRHLSSGVSGELATLVLNGCPGSPLHLFLSTRILYRALSRASLPKSQSLVLVWKYVRSTHCFTRRLPAWRNTLVAARSHTQRFQQARVRLLHEAIGQQCQLFNAFLAV